MVIPDQFQFSYTFFTPPLPGLCHGFKKNNSNESSVDDGAVTVAEPLLEFITLILLKKNQMAADSCTLLCHESTSMHATSVRTNHHHVYSTSA